MSEQNVSLPLSPVLGNRQSAKKSLRNRKRLKKEQSKVSLKSEESLNTESLIDNYNGSIENENISINNGLLENLEAVIIGQSLGSQAPFLIDPDKVSVNTKSEDILEHIKKLEALDEQKKAIIESISSKSNQKTSIKNNPTNSEKEVTNSIRKFEIANDMKEVNSSAPSATFGNMPRTSDIKFQTGSGLPIKIDDCQIESSKQLFLDILCPDKAPITQNNKFNYLHTKKQEINQTSSPVITTNRKELGKVGTIFNGEDFSDLKLNSDIGFKSLSAIAGNKCDDNLRQSQETLKESRTDLFQSKDISKTTYFKKDINQVNLSTNSIDIQSSSNELSSGFSNLNDNGNIKLLKTSKIAKTKNDTKNIFSGEDFSDLNLNSNVCFKSASVDLYQKVQGNSDKDKDNCQFMLSKADQEVRKNIFIGEDFSDLNLSMNHLFKSASAGLCQAEIIKNKDNWQPQQCRSEQDFKNKIINRNTSIKSTSKIARNIFEDENLNGAFSDLTSIKHLDRLEYTATKFCKEIPNSSASTNLFAGENFDDLNIQCEVKFESALMGLNKEKQFKKNVQDCKNIDGIFATKTNMDHEKRNLHSILKHEDLEVVSTCPIPNSSRQRSRDFRDIFQGENFDDLNLAGVSSSFNSCKRKSLETKHIQSFQCPLKISNSISQTESSLERGFLREEQQYAEDIATFYQEVIKHVDDIMPSTNEESITAPLINLATINNIRTKQMFLKRKRKYEIGLDLNSYKSSNNLLTPIQNKFISGKRKRLGCSVSPTISISETGLKKARLLFDDLGCKPITSTPLKGTGNVVATSFSCDVTPVQTTNFASNNSFFKNERSYSIHRSFTSDSTLTNRNKIVLSKPTQGDVNLWIENWIEERRILEGQLRIVQARQNMLVNQRSLLESSRSNRSKVLPGVLYKSKQTHYGISLREYMQNDGPESTLCADTSINNINPQNAHLVHFYFCDKEPYFTTKDGAVIIPNIHSKIGLSEIEHSFKLLENVDQNLLPQGWIKNHYKWIVWKLASYERSFKGKFHGCLSVENIVQQLKYRYDVEIDRVKRPILRKIFEKDDCSQRRIILCVSNILKLEQSYELELTDGWYSVRTLIDSPLCDQLANGKICIGVKLMIYGAELKNCEGCHPLEATNSSYLKINYNSTRRTLWWCKLGCQQRSGPFLIPMASIHMEGGKIGCFQCYIVRVYPVKYMEKYGGRNVWRNKKADERREQEFQNEKFKQFDKIGNKSKWTPISNKELKDVEDPKILYEMAQRMSDSEDLQEMLSSQQKTILHNYSYELLAQAQNLPNNSNISSNQRSVTSMLRIKIADYRFISNKIYDFCVWRPGEYHLHELKEGEVVTIFNASCSLKWGLSANQATQFKRVNGEKDKRFDKFKRKVTYISQLQSFYKEDRLLDEFDTVGLIIEKQIKDRHQEVWMSDNMKSLLVIEIRESSKNILALDTVDEGQIVSVSNLFIKRSADTHSEALGEHSVVFTKYPRLSHLQEAMEKLESDIANLSKESLMEDCKNRISIIKATKHFDNSTLPSNIDMVEMECSQMTMTDIALLKCAEELT